MSKSAWVFAGGNFCADQFDTARIADQDVLIGVDRGIEHCLSLDLIPDVLLGDFDSVERSILHDARLANSETIQHPSRKNSSDLELALHWLGDASIQRVVLFGISGGRSDHHLFNWMLPLQKSWPFAIEFVDHSVHAYSVTSTYPLNIPVHIGQTVSLLALPEACGVTTSGLEYALHDATLVSGSTLGLSNIAVSDTVCVSVYTGQLLVFRVKMDTTANRP